MKLARGWDAAVDHVRAEREHRPRLVSRPGAPSARSTTGADVGGPLYRHAMPFTYMLRCSDGSLYVGSTLDLQRRIVQHQAGKGSAYTRRRRPVQLIWSAEFERIDEAFRWEKRLQGWGHEKRLAFVRGGVEAVRGWSRRERIERSDALPGR